MNSVIDLWNKCLGVIKDNIFDSAFTTWFKPIIPLNYINKEIVLQVPTMFFYEYIEEKYSDLFSATIKKITSCEDTVLLYRVLIDKENNTIIDVPTTKKAQSTTQTQKIVSPFENTVDAPARAMSGARGSGPPVARAMVRDGRSTPAAAALPGSVAAFWSLAANLNACSR